MLSEGVSSPSSAVSVETSEWLEWGRRSRVVIGKCHVDCVGFIVHAKKSDLSMCMKSPLMEPEFVLGALGAVFPHCALETAWEKSGTRFSRSFSFQLDNLIESWRQLQVLEWQREQTRKRGSFVESWKFQCRSQRAAKGEDITVFRL